MFWTTQYNSLGRQGENGKQEGLTVVTVWSLVSRLVFCQYLGVPVAGGEIRWTMSAFEKPQIIAHIQKGLNYTVFDCKWVPCSAKFVTMGNFARGTGVIQLYEIQHGDLKLLREVGAGSKLPSSRIWDCRWGASADSGGEWGWEGSAFLFAKVFVQHTLKTQLKLRRTNEADRRLKNTST